MLRRFRLEEPRSVPEVSELLGRYGDSAKIYAGGTELLLAMKEGLVRYERLINVKGVPGLDGVRVEDGTLCVGSLCTHRRLERDPLVCERLPALAELEHNVANVRVREAGTIGGNLCFAEPHADPGTLLVALGASMRAERAGSKREIAAESFFVDAYETGLEPDEVLTEIRIPLPQPPSGIAYLKFGYLERPSVGVAVVVRSGASRAIEDIRVAVGCAGPAPRRAPEAEEILKGKTFDEAAPLLEQAGAAAARTARAISDLHGSQEYKEHIVGVLLKRAFQKAASQC
ncbi:MAG TPA: xanthine dehydrogenase family protein subunit M [candidate division Zixibacteria bacterium]|nr:xanthine dehydrogenase family protein subunit M [candidate division Zixibacteria bacterium]